MSTFEYDGLIVTTLELKTGNNGTTITSPEDNDGKEVYFESGSPNGTKAFFLTDIKGIYVRVWNPLNGPSYWKYTATVVSTTEASKNTTNGFKNGKETIPLFCIHGSSRQMYDNLKNLKENVLAEFEKAGNKGSASSYYPIPLVWAVGRSGIDYFLDRASAVEAGKIVRCFVECIPKDLFPRKSLMMHSMGNHLIHNGVCAEEEDPPNVEFDNIFMVAADIPADIFSDNPANKNVSGDDKKKVEHLKAMLGTNNDEGNIFVIHSTDDYTLKVVSPNLFNRGVQRLGLSGFNGIRDDFKDDVTNVNAKGNINSGSIGHNYQYDKWTIEQYHNLPTTTKK